MTRLEQRMIKIANNVGGRWGVQENGAYHFTFQSKAGAADFLDMLLYEYPKLSYAVVTETKFSINPNYQSSAFGSVNTPAYHKIRTGHDW